jgi:cytidine deaminase
MVICPVTMSLHSATTEKPTAHVGWDADRLLEAARKAQVNASVPLSRFRVGAAVLTRSGRVYEGCNTECLIPTLGVCAERNAINHAIVHGENDFLAIAVVSDLHAPVLPCGACLQYIQEFSRQLGRDILIIAEGRSGDRIVTSMEELFKGGFPADTTHSEIQECFSWAPPGDEA